MRSIIVSLLLLLVSLCLFAQPETHSRVRIHYSNATLPALTATGIALEGMVKKDAWLETDLSAAEINKVRQAGFQVDILIDDVSRYYRDRNEHPEKYDKPHPKTMDCDGSSLVNTPANFVLGSMGGYYTYTEMLAQLDSMRVHFPNLISVRQQIGTLQTIEGRPLYYVRISDNPDMDESEPEVMYSALTHAREPMGMQALIFYMWHLLESYGTDAEITALLNNLELYFVPCVNVDGYIYNETTDPLGGGMWRKNRRNSGGGDYGVDLNRNYGYQWGYDNTGSSPDPADETYRGTAGFSEPETQIMKWFCENRSFSTAIDYHCFGNYLIIPWCYIATPMTPDSVYYYATADLMSATNGYSDGNVWQTLGYMANGGSVDWFYGEQGTKSKIIAWSPEAGDGTDGFWPASNRIEDIAKVNIEQNLYVARFAGRYASLESLHSATIAQFSEYLPFTIQRLGLTASNFTVSLIPFSSNILSTGPTKNFNGLALLQSQTDSILFVLQPSVQAGDAVTFILRLDNGLYSTDDTLTFIYGTPVSVFADPCSNTSGWTTGGWALTTAQYHTAPSSITDSPSGNYGGNLNKSITLTSTIDLTNKVYAQLNFWAKWDIGDNYDFVQVKVSTNGGSTWTALCGKYTNPGTADQILDDPVYDGIQSTWVKEEIDLSPYIGNTIKIRFTLVSDWATSGDGFYFDDVEVTAIDPPVIGITQPPATGTIHVYPSPASDLLMITGTNGNNANFTIYDITGRELINGSTLENGIDIRSLKKGVYLIFVQIGGQAHQAKFIKE